MTDFSAATFFDLSTYAHSVLFQKGEMAWDALSKIKAYLALMPLGIVEGIVEKGAHLVNPESIVIGKGTIIESGAYIKGPCIIGAHCEVRHGAYIRGHVIVGNHCVIGHATEIKNSIFLDHAHAGHFAYVGESIVGNRVNLGAGVKCANLRLDQKEVHVTSQGKKIPTRLRKFGAILADDVSLGCNVVTNPGTVMEKKSSCYPCLNIFGHIPSNTIVK